MTNRPSPLTARVSHLGRQSWGAEELELPIIREISQKNLRRTDS